VVVISISPDSGFRFSTSGSVGGSDLQILFVRGFEGGWSAERVENVSESRKAAFFWQSAIGSDHLTISPRFILSRDLQVK
jgi:hypothetical protein